MSNQFELRKRELVDNLLTVYDRAIAADIVAGSEWYPAACALVRDWATHYALPDATVACVIAALSPQVSWMDNLIIADDILAGRPESIRRVLPRNVRVARLIAGGTPRATSTLIQYHFKSAPKVTAFALNLQGNRQAVTVDTHCLQAALDDVTATVSLKWSPYQTFAECYRLVAAKVQRDPCEFQAIIWHVWKRLYPRREKLRRRQSWVSIGEY